MCHHFAIPSCLFFSTRFIQSMEKSLSQFCDTDMKTLTGEAGSGFHYSPSSSLLPPTAPPALPLPPCGLLLLLLDLSVCWPGCLASSLCRLERSRCRSGTNRALCCRKTLTGPRARPGSSRPEKQKFGQVHNGQLTRSRS